MKKLKPVIWLLVASFSVAYALPPIGNCAGDNRWYTQSSHCYAPAIVAAAVYSELRTEATMHSARLTGIYCDYDGTARVMESDQHSAMSHNENN